MHKIQICKLSSYQKSPPPLPPSHKIPCFFPRGRQADEIGKEESPGCCLPCYSLTAPQSKTHKTPTRLHSMSHCSLHYFANYFLSTFYALYLPSWSAWYFLRLLMQHEKERGKAVLEHCWLWKSTSWTLDPTQATHSNQSCISQEKCIKVRYLQKIV